MKTKASRVKSSTSRGMGIFAILCILFLITLFLTLVLCSIRLSVGYVYFCTSSSDTFICHDLFCFRRGTAHQYYVRDRWSHQL